jgi:hypothetical protein
MTLVFSRISNLNDIDRLGELKAQIADIQSVADGLAATIKEMGAGKHDGEMFSATVSVIDERWSSDPKAIAAKLLELMGKEAFDRFTASHQKKTVGYTTLKLTARD